MRFRRTPTPPAPAAEPDVLKTVVPGPDGPRLALGFYGDLGARITSGRTVDIDLTALTSLGVTRLTLAAGTTREDVQRQLEHHLGPLPFTCPRCTRTSHHPLDRRYGYCAACNDYTGAPS
ncbi:hypothetical protein ACIOK4_00265 [Streptomyces bottropensis]|uniref:hypothetical protein n=1 Tax=Streptomyces bottropensis TaxID=42235 RepID=UPI0037FF50D4